MSGPSRSAPPSADSGTAYVHVKDHGAKLDGVTDDTAALLAAGQAARDLGGGRVFIPGHLLARSVTLFPTVIYAGVAVGASQIIRANGVNADFVKTAGFDANTGTTNVGTDHDYGFENISLVGNSANNTAGRGIAAFGYRPLMRWVEITDFNDVGLYHEWRATAGTPSSGLAEHDMHGRLVGLDIHDNLGGGLDWNGPSDSNAISCDIYRNGPAASSTTIGLRVRGTGNSFRASLCHAWGTQHNFGASFEASGPQLHECDWEGSITAPVVIDSSNGVIKGGKIFTPGASGVGIQFGVVGHSTCGGWDIDTFMSACNVSLLRDGGGNTWKIHAYWADNTKKLFTGTMSAGTPSYFDCFTDGGLQLGLANFSAVATRRARLTDVKRIATPRIPSAVLAESMPRELVTDTALGAFTSGDINGVLMQLEADRTYTGGGFFAKGAAAGVSNIWYALYAYDPTPANQLLLAITADDGATGWAANTDKPLNFTTPYTPSTDQLVYLFHCVVATTMPTLVGQQFLNTNLVTKAPRVSGSRGSYTTPASAPANIATLSGGTKYPYAYLF